MDDMYLFKSQDEDNRLLYAYYKGEFWFYDPNVQQWYISRHVREQYELETQKDISLTPDDFTCTGYGYEFVAEYEVPVSVLDALRNARKISPKEEPVPGQDNADAPAEDAAAAKQSAENPAAPEDGANPTPAAPASRADAGAAAQNLSAAGPASLEAKDMNVPAFDYSGLDLPTRDTLHWAEKEIGEARRDYIARIAQAVSIAHDALCATVVQNLDNGKFTKSEESFQRWCESVGIKRSTAYNLLQVQALLSGSTPEEQATLEAASPSLLYAAAKPSAPAELVQAVKDGDITTHKQYQEALAEIRARDARIKDLLELSDAADRRAEEEERKRRDAQRELEQERAANAGSSALLADEQQRRQQANEARIAAENRAAGAQKLADQRAAENTELKAKLRELESRPVDVAVAQPGQAQIEAWRREGEARVLSAAKDLAGKARQAQQQAECHASDLEEENNRLRDALNRTRQLDQSAALACGACSAALGAWFESTARDVPADLGPALIRMKRLRLALDIAIENGVWPDDAALDDLEANGNG